MFCPNPTCRAELSDDAKSCIKCGYDFAKIKTPPANKHVQDSLDIVKSLLSQETDAENFKIGSLFANRYEILSEGKKGGMGVVYKCRDAKLNKIVALKVIHPKLLSSQDALYRFRQEVSISLELQHKNIVRVFNLEEWEDKEYFTMEWVEGTTLREIIKERQDEERPFSLEEANTIISQLSDALHYAHKSTIHRDIKPENILIANKGDGGGFSVKLTDFGIAKMLGPSQLKPEDPNVKMGTPYYMAPEQRRNAANVDKRADIYSLGVVLFELLTLENTIGLELPSELNKDLPKVIDNVIKKAVATKPEDRYGDVKELSEGLRKVVTDAAAGVGKIVKGGEQKEQAEEELKRQEAERKRKEDDRKKREAEQSRLIVNKSFTDNGDGTITDNVTGLVWQKGENPATYNWYQASGIYDATHNPTSQDVCGSLSLAGGGWRLPTRTELESLVDKNFTPTIDTTYFPNAHASVYWSSTTYVTYPDHAGYVHFYNGYVYYYPKANRYHIRCVRERKEDDRRKQDAEQSRLEALKKKQDEEELKRQEAERKRKEDDRRKREAEQSRLEALKKKQDEEELKRQEAERKRKEDDRRKQAEDPNKRKTKREGLFWGSVAVVCVGMAFYFLYTVVSGLFETKPSGNQVAVPAPVPKKMVKQSENPKTYRDSVTGTEDTGFTFSGLTALDKTTRLMWTKDGNIAGKKMKWKDAIAYVQELNNERYAGYNDWRLPEKDELAVMAKYGKNAGYGSTKAKAIAYLFNSKGFAHVQYADYWSSTTSDYNTLHAWSVNFYNGNGSRGFKLYTSYYVWPVRGGQSGNLGRNAPPNNPTPQANTTPQASANVRFTDNGNGTITDNEHRLVWQKGENPTRYNWYQAAGTYEANYNPSSQNVCGSLSLAGSGWRLPTKDELFGLVDTSFKPTINTTFFPNAHADNYSFYWLSTTDAYYPGFGGYALYFNTGSVVHYDTSLNGYVRCVRGGQSGNLGRNTLPNNPTPQANTTPQASANKRFTDNGDGTITDNEHRLVWQKGENPTKYNWYQASGIYDAKYNPTSQNVCGSLSLAGGGWRLPTLLELIRLVSGQGQTITTYFPNAHYSDSYFGFASDNGPGIAAGIAGRGDESGVYYVRCIRGGQ